MSRPKLTWDNLRIALVNNWYQELEKAKKIEAKYPKNNLSTDNVISADLLEYWHIKGRQSIINEIHKLITGRELS